MKAIKIVALSLLTACALVFGACSRKSAVSVPAKHAISVVATIFPPFDFARQIADGKADVTMLLPPGAESHSYEPTPQDVIKIQNCNVFIYCGGDSDAWVDKILASMDTSKMKIVKMMDACPTVPEETVKGMQKDPDDDDSKTPGVPAIDYDEHVWTSPANAVLIVQASNRALDQADPANAAFYNGNTGKYVGNLKELDSLFKNVVSSSKRKEIVVGDRFPFRYFVDRYGLKYYAAFPGCSTQTEASAVTVAFLIDKVKQDKIPVVFHIELSSGKIAQTIAAATGARVAELDAIHNVSKAEFAAGATYISLMKQNAAALKEALN
jgi:zinc transport system substrate-binding protein